MKRSIFLALILILLIPLTFTACSPNGDTDPTASGTLSSIEIPISPEISGRVVQVNVNEGDQVEAGDILFQIDREIPQAQYDQAAAARNAAQATLETAQTQLQAAQIQLDLTTQGVRIQSAQSQQGTGNVPVQEDYLPAWYYQKNESIAAVQTEIDAAQSELATEKSKLAQEQNNIDNQDFIEVEQKLAEAQVRYSNAQAILANAQAGDDQELIDAAQIQSDAAASELETARLAYQRKLNTEEADAILTARARVAVAQSRYDNALLLLYALQTDDESIQVKAAAAGVETAQAAVNQAQANLEQADAALNLASLQLDRTDVKAPVAGTLLTRSLETGELAAAGGVVMTISPLDTLDLTVYVPEDQYGSILVGQRVEVRVDSYPQTVFSGQVTRIASQAEFTPRNVQTKDSRTSTVFAIKISVPNPDGKLKPGMPADVVFGQ